MHLLESARLAHDRSSEVSLVPGLPLLVRRLEGNVTAFEDLDRQGVGSIRIDGLQQARKQACTDDLTISLLGTSYGRGRHGETHYSAVFYYLGSYEVSQCHTCTGYSNTYGICEANGQFTIIFSVQPSEVLIV